eukprot:UN19623
MGLLILGGLLGDLFSHMQKCNYLYYCANPEAANDDFPMCWSQQSRQYHVVWFLQIYLPLSGFVHLGSRRSFSALLFTYGQRGEKSISGKDIQTAFILWLPLGWICASHRLYLTRKPFSYD